MNIKLKYFIIIVFVVIYVCFVHCESDEVVERNLTCKHTLYRPKGFFRRHFDTSFWKKFFKHWIPFTNRSHVKMQFFLFKRDFPECGREIIMNDDDSLEKSEFNAEHPTRIIIHGWMSQSKGSLNRAVKNAYFALALKYAANNTYDVNSTSIELTEQEQQQNKEEELQTDGTDSTTMKYPTDFNVIVIDWSVISTNINYYSVVEMIEDLGYFLAEFVRYLHIRAGLHFDDVYLIGHSLGAQIAGSAGKQIQPFRFNTIYALDPAGPKFRDLPADQRIDSTDANYVESIQTSSTFGFQDPIGHATFYPNYGKDQKNCYMYGCSHSRAHHYFAESIISDKGFWGALCQRQSEDEWLISRSGAQFRMGGEPSTPKHGTFYVKTNNKSPYAMGKRKLEVVSEIEGNEKDLIDNIKL